MIKGATKRKTFGVITTIVFLFSIGCAPKIPPEALVWNQETLKDRQLQTRRFDTNDEELVLQAVAGLLQDLGFNRDESETKLGIIVASKERDAQDGENLAKGLLLALIGVEMPLDYKQKLRASVVTFPASEGDFMNVRVTFQRIVWSVRGKETKREGLDDPEFYKEFFEKLSKSMFLEAHAI